MDKNEIPSVKKQRWKSENGKHLQLSKKIENVSVIINMTCILKILIIFAQFRSLKKNPQIIKNVFFYVSFDRWQKFITAICTEAESSGPHPDILLLKLLFHVTFSYTSPSSNTSSSSFIATKILYVSDLPLPDSCLSLWIVITLKFD